MDALGQTVAQSPGQSHRQGHQFGGLGAGTAEHHALVAGTAHFVVGAQSNISGLGVDTALDLHGFTPQNTGTRGLWPGLSNENHTTPPTASGNQLRSWITVEYAH